MNEPARPRTPGASDIDAARRVLRLESGALQRMADELGDEFVAAVDLLQRATGRIVVSGMGKSGHIGNKIAATLASTGAPAVFVHPAEASHGDLGMITRDDALLVLSNSGETVELGDTLEYAKRFEIPLVAIVGKANTTLADAASVALVLPDEPEGGTLGLAPTTSTTMTLAMGDALAVALFERNGFGPSDFQVFHPGGKLGQRLLRVSGIMHSGDEVPVAGPDTAMSDALLTMTTKSFGCVAVTDTAGHLLGLVTDGDLRRHMNANLLEMTTRDVMTTNPQTIRPGALAAEALGIMNERKITSLFVVEDGVLQGIIHIHDCLRAGIA
ncbi:MAG: KpsF/GutQ family sugar-phosphate isomerase [Alphaproteobacteria bacterium]|jgi:arabinose-5-phosphate isomerase|nr:KpsF/GutQ family sugar-phosphate isomerase [Alphaproteobacteria bacterium]